jgi:hypothetical protein
MNCEHAMLTSELDAYEYMTTVPTSEKLAAAYACLEPRVARSPGGPTRAATPPAPAARLVPWRSEGSGAQRERDSVEARQRTLVRQWREEHARELRAAQESEERERRRWAAAERRETLRAMREMEGEAQRRHREVRRQQAREQEAADWERRCREWDAERESQRDSAAPQALCVLRLDAARRAEIAELSRSGTGDMLVHPTTLGRIRALDLTPRYPLRLVPDAAVPLGEAFVVVWAGGRPKDVWPGQRVLL